MDSDNARIVYDEIVVQMQPPSSSLNNPPSADEQPRKRIKGNAANSRRTPSEIVDHSDNEATQIDTRAYPELHSLRLKLKEAYRRAEIPPDHQLRLSKDLQKHCNSDMELLSNTSPKFLMRSWRLQFQRIALALELLLSKEGESCLDPLEYFTLLSLLARPPMFACSLVPILVPSLGKMDISGISSIYGEFCRFVHETSQSMPVSESTISTTPSPSALSFPILHLTLKSLGTTKHKLKKLKRHVRAAADALRHIHVHRLEYVPDRKRFEEEVKTKKLVLDSPDYAEFPRSRYHHIDTKKAYIIEPKVGDNPQFHLLVLQTPDTPANDEKIIELWQRNRKGEGVPASFWNWYVGAQVFNVFLKDEMLRKELSELTDTLVNAVKKRTKVERGKGLHSDGIMAGLAQPWVEGNGVCRQYRNYKNSTDREELVKETEAIIENWIAVSSFVAFLILPRFWRPFSPIWC